MQRPIVGLLRLFVFAFLMVGAAGLRLSAAPHAPSQVEPVPDKQPAWVKPYRIRFALHVTGDRTKQKAASIIARLPTGGWLKPDGSDVAVQTASGEMLPVNVLSHDPMGETMIQFPRNGDDVWYWAYAVAANATPKTGPPIQEGLSVEVRRWAGEDIADWAAVRAGLEQSSTVIGNSLADEVIQVCNPVRPNDPRQFAASYRGYIKAPTDGVYRFFLNAEDAAFLFIDGFKVIDRGGNNQVISGRMAVGSVGNHIELKAGVHSIEVHHIIGNNPNTTGYCELLWVPPGAKSWTYVPRTSFAHAAYAQVGTMEQAEHKAAAQFVHGVDDTLRSGEGGLTYLVRFEATGEIPAGTTLAWDFGDGTKGTGHSPVHVYFHSGDYVVTLQSGSMPPFRRSVHVWPAPGNTSPLSLGVALRSLASSDWKSFDYQRLHEMFQFLLVCEQPDRWPLMDAVTERLLTQPGLDLKLKVVLYTSRMEALARQGKAVEALALGERALPEFSKVPSLLAGMNLAIAQVYQRHLHKPDEAGKIYESIVNGQRRMEHPNIRIAAIRWGDLFAEAGNLTRAGECYRQAAKLGGASFEDSSLTGAATRGGLLRIAEQKLRSGDIQQTRLLLDKIELQYPEEKLEGMYRMLKADADRQGGRYEEALRNYEILLKLTQWAGLRDRALHGIADTYNRMGDLTTALKWLDMLKQTYPDYFKKQNLDPYRELLITRQARRTAAGDKGDPATALSSDIVFGFEPNEGVGTLVNFTITPGFGIAGPHVGLCAGFPTNPGVFQLTRTLKNITANGEYWVELWYRDMLLDIPYRPRVNLGIRTPEGFKVGGGGMAESPLERTFGQWRKIGFLLKAPPGTDGSVSFFIFLDGRSQTAKNRDPGTDVEEGDKSGRMGCGIIEIDGFSVRAVSDHDSDALNNFLKGTESE